MQIPDDMLFLGGDPDTQNAAMAVVDARGKPIAFFIFKQKIRNASGAEAVASIVQAMVQQIREWRQADSVLATGLKHPYVCAIEGQEVTYSSKKGVPPGALLPVAQVAGAMMTVFQLFGEDGRHLYIPRPKDWKGQVPKRAHQARIYSNLKWSYKTRGSEENGYCEPTSQVDIVQETTAKYGASAWKHLGDALGLALWARNRYAIEPERVS